MGCNVSTRTQSKMSTYGESDHNINKNSNQLVVEPRTESTGDIEQIKSEVHNRKTNSTIKNNNFNDNEILTDDQKKLIRASWNRLAPNAIELGRKVFLRIFDTSPQVKKMFPFENKWGEVLVNDPLFKSHSMRFIQIIQSCVDSLDDLENGLIPVILNLGRFHQRKAIWFEVDYFGVFQDALLYIWSIVLGCDFDMDTKNAWIVLFAFIVKWLKEGYGSGACPSI